MMDLTKRPLLKALKAYEEEAPLRYHMPGHREEDLVPSLKDLQAHLYAFDVTEVPGTDHLHYPEGPLKDSQELLAKAMGAKESLYSINGSTGANFALLFGLLQRGDQILLQRNAHQSIYHAMDLLSLQPTFLFPEMDPSFSLPLQVTLAEIQEKHQASPQAKAVVLTSPSYYGTLCDVASISKYCDHHGLYLLVDEAHGAHFPFSEGLPPTALSQGAHGSCVSFHKTLPVLTQGAVLNLSHKLTEEARQRVRHYHRIFQSSSPSYTLLASMENARALMEEEGEARYEKLMAAVKTLKEALKKLPFVEVLSLKGMLQDTTRLVIQTPLVGDVLAQHLREDYGIQCEMSEGHGVVFILSPFDAFPHYEKLVSALKDLGERFSLTTIPRPNQSLVPSMNFSIQRVLTEEEALFSSGEEVPWEEALGRISLEKIISYPPGIPVILPGEVCTKEALAVLKYYQNLGHNLLRSVGQKPSSIVVKKNP